MQKEVILLIETATRNCSVAICIDGNILGELNESADQFVHAEKLHVLIERLLSEQKIHPSELKAIAVGKGPGSYTGLRIGVSAAKGLAFALDIPLIAVNTLELLCDHSRQLHPTLDLHCALLDARRNEVYMAAYDKAGNEIIATGAFILDADVFAFASGKSIRFVGDGVTKSITHFPQNSIHSAVQPNASMMARLAYSRYLAGQFEDTDQFEPFYLKDFLPGLSKRSILN